MMRHLYLAVLATALLLPTLVRAELTPEQIRADFDFFWNSYQEAYVFWELKAADHGVDWTQLKAEYEPTLAVCKTKADLLRLITEMQTRLGDGHCQNEGLTALGPIALVRGIAFTVAAGNKVLVRACVTDGPIGEAGISRGDEVLRFAGTTIKTLARRARSLIGASSEGQFWSMFTQMLHVYNPLLGAPPVTCSCQFRKPDGTIIDVDLPWSHIDPSASKAGPSLAQIIEVDAQGPLPMEAMIFEDVNIGYASVQSFMKTEYPKDQLDKVFGALASCDALILDLRNNGGGVGPWGVLLANYFIAEGPNDSYMERLYSRTFFRTILAQLPPAQVESFFTNPQAMQMLFAKLGITLSPEELASHFVDGQYSPQYHSGLLKDMVGADLQPGIPVYEKPLYVLTNGGCYSTTDICLKLLTEYNRATVVGTPNGAGSGSPIPFLLPNAKVKVMVCHARAYPPSGEMIEGRPVEPDVLVMPTQADVVSGTDRILATALGLAAQELGLIDGGSKTVLASHIEPADLTTRTITNTTASAIPPELRALVPTAVREAQFYETLARTLTKELRK